MAGAGTVRPAARTAGRAARAWVHCGRLVFTHRGSPAAVGLSRRMVSGPCGGEVVRPARLREAGTESAALPGGQRGHPRQRGAALGVSGDHGGGGDSAGHDGLASRWAARTGGGTAERGRGRVWSRRPKWPGSVDGGHGRLPSAGPTITAGAVPSLSGGWPPRGVLRALVGWFRPRLRSSGPTVMTRGAGGSRRGAADARPGSCRRWLEGGGGDRRSRPGPCRVPAARPAGHHRRRAAPGASRGGGAGAAGAAAALARPDGHGEHAHRPAVGRGPAGRPVERAAAAGVEAAARAGRNGRGRRPGRRRVPGGRRTRVGRRGGLRERCPCCPRPPRQPGRRRRRRGRRAVRRGAGPMGRRAARGLRRPAVGDGRGGPARAAAARGADRARAAAAVARPARRRRRRPRPGRRRGPDPRDSRRAADDGPVPVRAAGGRAGGVLPHPCGPGRRARPRAVRRAARPAPEGPRPGR